MTTPSSETAGTAGAERPEPRRAAKESLDVCPTCGQSTRGQGPMGEGAAVNEPPVRLCCFQRHSGPICPDGLVMCQLCYGRFEIQDLHMTEDGTPEDVCKPCAEADAEAAKRWGL